MGKLHQTFNTYIIRNKNIFIEYLKSRLRMRLFVICITLAASQAGPQLKFSNSKPKQQDKPSDDGVNTRLGLLAGQLGLDPIAQTQGGSSSSSSSGLTSNSGFNSTNSVPSTSSQNAAFTPGSEQASG